jgi:hypothetical protein
MKIEFKRTGGFSTITDASGEVHSQTQGGEVSSPGSSYRRSLTKDELIELQKFSSDQAFGLSRTASPPTAVPDGFTYEITVTTDDGKTYTFDSSQPKRVPPTQLLNWVQEECQRILSYKVKGR